MSTPTTPNLKPDLITWLATLPDTDPALAAVDAIRRGGDKAEETPRLLLKEVAEAVGRTPSYLWRLGVPEACGVRNAGGLRYSRSAVLAYLASPECAERVETLHRQRKAREGLPLPNEPRQNRKGRRAGKVQHEHARESRPLPA